MVWLRKVGVVRRSGDHHVAEFARLL